MAKKFDAKAKAKRQKIILAVLGLVFVAVLAWQVPSVLAIMNKKPVPAATTPPSAAAPAPLPTPGVPATPGTPVSATPTGALVDSDPTAQAAGGQLVTFDRFESKDPFAQQVGAPCDSEDASCVAGSDEPAAKAKPADPPATTLPPAQTSPQPPPVAVQPTSAEISVNGELSTVGEGGTFPESDPMFKLVSVSNSTAKIAISGGSLDTGSGTVTLKKGKKLTLENTVDGARYVLLFVSAA